VQFALGELGATDNASGTAIDETAARRRSRRGITTCSVTIEDFLAACKNDPSVDYEITDKCLVDQLKATYSNVLPITESARLYVRCCIVCER
jgi:hypothetical protein